MTSKVGIINRALQHNGAKRVVLADDSVHSQEANAMFDTVRDAELRMNVWHFSIRRAALARSATLPVWSHVDDLFYYPFPTGYLRLVEVENHPREQKVEAEGIVSAQDAPLNIRYVERVEDTARFDALFVEMFALSLALNMSEGVKSSGKDKIDLRAEYEQFKMTAVSTNAIELPPLQEDVDDWLLARI